VDPPSSTALPAAAQSSKQPSGHPKPSPSAKSSCVPHEDHIYSEVDKSCKKSASSTSSPPARLTHKSSTTAKGAVPTQKVTMDHVYAAVDYSKKVEKRQEMFNVFIHTLTFSIYAAFKDVTICMFAISGKHLNCVLPYYGTCKFRL